MENNADEDWQFLSVYSDMCYEYPEADQQQLRYLKALEKCQKLKEEISSKTVPRLT